MAAINFKNPFLKYARSLAADMPRHVALVMGLMFFMAVFEGASLLLLIPMLQLVGLDVGEGSMGQIAGSIAYAFSAFNVKPTIESVLVIYIAVVSLQSGLSRLQSNTSSYIQHNFITHIRERFYRALANADYLHLSKRRSSDLAQLLMQETDRIGYGTYQVLYLAVNVIVALVYVALAVRISTGATLMVLAAGACLVVLLKGRTERSRATGRKIFQSNKNLYASALEHMSAMKTTKSYSAEERNTEIFSRQAKEIGAGNIEVSREYAAVTSLYEIGSVIALSAIFYVSIKVFEVPLTSMLVLLYIFARLMPKFSTIQGSYQRFIMLMPAFTALDQTVREMEDEAEVKTGRVEEVSLESSVKFRDVHFSYNDSSDKGGDKDGTNGYDNGGDDVNNGPDRLNPVTPVLAGIDLRVPVGQTVGLVGPSGSGKSTVADLLMGLIKPSSGSIIVDGEPLTPERFRAWRRLIGYVSQDTFLFNDTVRANLLWACPEASEDDMIEALRLAAADEFVSRLPQGLDTLLGDRGIRLSGGERQRLALARALLRKPSLLILDEATSNLDSESERRIQEAVEGLHGRLTTFVITHRLSTLGNADEIYVLEGGKISEHGSRDELFAMNGRFRELCETQGMGSLQRSLSRTSSLFEKTSAHA